MRDLIIRNLDDALIIELKRRAWHQGLPLEQSLRRLLVESVESGTESDVFMPRVAIGGVERRWLAS